MKALIFKEKVIQLEETAFEVHSDLVWVDASAECKIGWGYKNNSFIPTVELTDEEKKTANFARLRKARTARLETTDWMANSDVTMSDAWKTYRQQLRDLPANTSDPANPTWPTKPE